MIIALFYLIKVQILINTVESEWSGFQKIFQLSKLLLFKYLHTDAKVCIYKMIASAHAYIHSENYSQYL